MPISAGEHVSQMNNLQHMAMLSSMGGGGADQLAGMGLARSAAIGKPLMSAGLGLLGLDPMSLGIKAGMHAWGSGAGMLGTGMAAGAVMLPAAIGGSVAAYAGSQMMGGAQQQLQLNRGLQQFNFMNNQGSMGFTTNQGYQIGSHLRGMTGAIGMNGEISGFDELSRLATNMGRMGLAQNVRTVADFKDKFKEMLNAVKTIAHDMGTSLEEAQKVMAAMKSSGVFKAADAMKMSGAIRVGALAGGLASSEMSAMASIGSQIARSVGGLGRQGAFGGLRAMEQIGIAQRVGAVSEEDIYNATGLTGAEGRQSFAASQMQRSAEFMRSGRGRYFLASIAGKDGSLNESAVNEWLSGGMTTERTRQLAQQNLAGVGRANFTRNEGHLRGAALEKFGAMAQTMAYREWLSGRGYDPSNMDDRSMLAFQRYSGMGRDEADLAIKQINALPEMAREFQEAQRGMGHSDKLAKHFAHSGMRGLKHKFEEVKESINNKFQEAGSRILQVASDGVQSWFNHVMGVYVDVSTEGIDEIARNMELGGKGAQAQYRKFFGGAGSAIARGGAGAGGDFANRMLNQSMQFSAMAGSQDAAVSAFAKENADSIRMFTMNSSSSVDMIAQTRRYLSKKAATDPKARDMLEKFNSGSIHDRTAIVQTLQESAEVGRGGTMLNALGEEASKFEYTPGSSYHTEAEFRGALGRRLLGDTPQSVHEQAAGATWWAKAGGKIAASLAGGSYGDALSAAGIRDDKRSWWEKTADALNPGLAQMRREMAGERDPREEFEDQITAGLNTYSERYQWAEGRYRGVAGLFGEKKGLAMISNLYSDDAEERRSGQSSALSQLEDLRKSTKGKDRTGEQQGKIEGLANLYLGSRYGKELDEFAETGKTDKLDEIKEAWEQMTGDKAGSTDELMRQIKMMKDQGGVAALQEQQLANFKRDHQRLTEGIEADRKSAIATGHMVQETYTDGDGNKKTRLVASRTTAEERAKMDPAARAVAELGDRLVNFDLDKPSEEGRAKYLAENMHMLASDDEYQNLSAEQKAAIDQAAAHREYYDMTGKQYEDTARLSVEQKKQLVKHGGKEGSIAGYTLQLENRFNTLMKGEQGGDIGAAAKLLGLNLSKEQYENVAKGGDPAEKAARLVQHMGLTGDDATKMKDQIAAALGEKTSGGKALGIDRALKNMSPDAQKTLQDEKAKKEDPSYRMLEQIRGEAVKHTGFLTKIASRLPATAAEIAAAAKTNPEAKPGMAAGDAGA